MTAVQHRTSPDVLVENDIVTHSAARRGLAVLRIGVGLTFLWAFLDKLLALGYATGKNTETGAVDRFGPDAWINEGNPTLGFLKFGVSPDNPFRDTFNSIAGDAWTNWLFMLGLLGIGGALILGAGLRIAAVTGGLLMVLMWAAELPLANNPFMDDHIIYALVLAGLAVANAGDTLGIGRWWASTELVQRFPFLR